MGQGLQAKNISRDTGWDTRHFVLDLSGSLARFSVSVPFDDIGTEFRISSSSTAPWSGGGSAIL